MVVLGALAIALALASRHASAVATGSLALALLIVASTPAIQTPLQARLEGAVPPPKPGDRLDGDAILLLAGGVSPGASPRLPADLGAAADRVLYAARLARAAPGRIVVSSGGSMPWGRGVTPARAMKDLLVEWGVPAGDVRLEETSRNTYENCRNSARLLREMGARRVLLVTSALHMRRALATCRTQGIPAVPAPTDFEAWGQPEPEVLSWMPDAAALERTHRTLKELLGYQVYRLRGWIDPERVAELTPPARSRTPGSSAAASCSSRPGGRPQLDGSSACGAGPG